MSRVPLPSRAAAVLAVTLSLTAESQQAALRAGQRPGPRFVVATFRGDTNSLGFEMAGALRSRLATDVDIRTLLIVPESLITKALIESGFGPKQALDADDNRALASQFQAEEYVEGRVRRTADGGYRAEAQWTLTRRDDMSQPIPPVEARKLSDVARLLSAQVLAARKQVAGVRRCMDLSRAGDHRAALVEARNAIAVYPTSVLARVCIANSWAEQKLGADSMLRITGEILALQPTNRRALAFAADAYHEKGMRDQEIAMLVALFGTDSTNVRVAAGAARALADARRYDEARALLGAALRHREDDTELLTLQWRVALAMRDWRGAIAAGEQLTRVDSSAADVDYFQRMSAALVEDSQPGPAAAIAGRGARKFPDNDELAVLEVQLLRRSGQLQPALDATTRLLARNPKANSAWLQRARTQAELGLPADSIVASLRQGVTNGEDRSIVAGYAATLGQAASRTAAAAKSIDDFRLSIRYFRLAEDVLPRDTTAFLLGAANVSLAQLLYGHARDNRNCDEAREMQAALVDAQLLLTRGGRSFPSVAAQLMTRAREVAPFAAQLERAVCKRE